MDPVRPGANGPGVEDIQQRLRLLGYDLGRAGIDGIYQGKTRQAVKEFQASAGLDEDGWVGDQTWSALVDATFILGDRMLYLRLPHFHGHDVSTLQDALNILGFTCGASDAIFGAFTERAVREFQRNTALPADGIVGAETVRAVAALRHVWEGRHPQPHSAARLAPARAAEVLSNGPVWVGGLDGAGERIAKRVVNLALATTESSCVNLIARRDPAPCDTALTLRICVGGTVSAEVGRPVVRLEMDDLFASRLLTAVQTASAVCPEIAIELPEEHVNDERDEQSAAVRVLDALCVALDR